MRAAVEAIRREAVDAAPAIIRLAEAVRLMAPGMVDFGDCELDSLADAFREIVAQSRQKQDGG